MTTGLKVIKSISMTDAMLVGTNVPETEHPTYNAGATYASGARVILNHKIYESVQDGNTGKDPLTTDGWWSRVSPTNRWKPFDLSSTTRLQLTGPAYYEIKPNTAVSAVMFIDCDGLSSIRVRLIEDGVTHYDSSHLMRPTPSTSSWYAWTFEQRAPRSRLVVQDLPARPRATLRVDFEITASAGYIGTLAFGRAYVLGEGVQYGARVGVQDFSRKERNEYGEMELIRRGNAKTMSLQISVDNKKLDSTDMLLSSLTGTPCLWIGTSRFSALSLWGVFTNWNYTVAYYDQTDLSVEVEEFV